MFAIQAMRQGGPEVLAYNELPDPVPGPGQVLVDVRAAGVNFIDTYRRGGMYPMPFPHIVGSEGAGTVAALGEGVSTVAVGDAVAWHDAPGSYATRVVVAEKSLLPVPDGVDFPTAAAIPLQGLTAQYRPGDRHGLHPAEGGPGAGSRRR